jgi:opacity protein-like surface antigen
MRINRVVLWAACGVLAMPSIAFAQEDRRIFVGALIGISTLSADGRAVTTAGSASISLYKPENGPALNVFTGVHLGHYFSVQGNYLWNRNDVLLVSSVVSGQGGGFYEQRRTSAQHAFVADALIYFRRLDSRIRPYLGTGLATVRFKAKVTHSMNDGLAAPDGDITSTNIALRSHVGIDVAVSRHLSLRYSFSETLGRNPISPRLSPPGERALANFENLFGAVARF